MPVITYFEADDGDKLEVKEGRLWYNGHGIADAREFADFIYAELAKAEPTKDAPAKPDVEGWIKWEGGECPVGFNERVDLTLRDGSVLFGRRAGDWDWQHDGGSADLMRYRPSKGGAE